MAEYSPEEVKQRYVAAMGKDLGEVFHLLWNECTWLHWKWSDYETLFGTKPERVDLLNQAAPSFFWIVQDAMWRDILLHLCRLTDPPKSCGKDTLTLRRVPDLVPLRLRPKVDLLLREILRKSEFARDWRNRLIAHTDLDHALDRRAAPIKSASRRKIKDVLEAIVEFLNYIENEYCNSESMYLETSPGSAHMLLRVLRNGVDAEEARRERLRSGKPLPTDLRPPTAV